jgi:hypothetical protein
MMMSGRRKREEVVKPHLSMSLDADRTTFWINCTCGWEGASRTVQSDGTQGKVMFDAMQEGREHIAAEHPQP